MPVSKNKPAPVASRSAKSKHTKEEENYSASFDAFENPNTPVDLYESDFANEAEAEADPDKEFSDIISYSDRLHRAMAAVDIQLALEDLDREESQLGARSAMTPDADEDLAEDLALEELLSRELSEDADAIDEQAAVEQPVHAIPSHTVPMHNAPTHATAEIPVQSDPDIDDKDEQDAIVGLATLHVERACRDVIDEAKSDALMRRIVKQRKEAMNMAVTSDEQPDYEVELPEDEARNSFTSAFTARRLSYASAAVAILAVGIYASANINSLPVFSSAFLGQSEEAANTTASMTAVPGTASPTRDTEPALTAAVQPESTEPPVKVTPVEETTIVKQAKVAAPSNPSPLLTAPVAEEATQKADTDPAAVKQAVTASVEPSSNQVEQAANTAKTEAAPVVKLANTATTVQKTGNTPATAVQAVNSVAPVANGPSIKYSNSYAASDAAGSANQAWNENLNARMGTGTQPSTGKTAATTSGNAPSQDTLTDEDRRIAALPDDPPLLNPEENIGNTDGTQQTLRRSEQAVERALSQSLGLEGVGKQARADLKNRLVAGECLSTALSEVLGQVPIVAMRDLILSLDSEC